MLKISVHWNNTGYIADTFQILNYTLRTFRLGYIYIII